MALGKIIQNEGSNLGELIEFFWGFCPNKELVVTRAGRHKSWTSQELDVTGAGCLKLVVKNLVVTKLVECENLACVNEMTNIKYGLTVQ